MPQQQDVGKPPIISVTTRGKRGVQPSRTDRRPDFDVTIGTLDSRKRNQPTSENAEKNLNGENLLFAILTASGGGQ